MVQPAESRADAQTLAPVAPAAASGQTRASWLGSVSRYLLPAVVILIFLAIWQFLPPAVGIPQYELPNLSETLLGLQQDWGDIGNGLLITLQDAVIGFVIGNVLALLGATLFSYSKNAERAFYPLAILIQTVPIIVYVPLLVILFDRVPIVSANSEASAVVGVTVLISFFPTLVNMTVGFNTIDPRIFELMKLLNASRTQIFLKLRFPSALPFFFSSLKITSTLAFVGALVGEWMTGNGLNPVGQLLASAGVSTLFGFPTNPGNAGGVGNLLNIFYFRIDKPGIFASVFAVSIMTMLFFGLMVLLERIVVPWQETK